MAPPSTPHFGLDIGGTLGKVVFTTPGTAPSSPSSDLVGALLNATRYGESGVREVQLALPLENGSTLHFVRFLTARAEAAIEFVAGATTGGEWSLPRVLSATGGGALRLRRRLREALHVELAYVDEFTALVEGVRFLLRTPRAGAFTLRDAGRFRSAVGSGRRALTEDSMGDVPIRPDEGFLLVNIGSGVSILQVYPEGEDGSDRDGRRFERVGGSSLGGATFLGLCSLLTGATTFEAALVLASKGDSTKVDMLVRDIYGGADGSVGGGKAGGASPAAELGLQESTLASSFGKMVRAKDRVKATAADLALATLIMISMNVAAIAHLHAKIHVAAAREGGKPRPPKRGIVLFTGSFLAGGGGGSAVVAVPRAPADAAALAARNVIAMRTFSFATSFWSKGRMAAAFLRHEGFAGALGALLRDKQPHPPHLQVPADGDRRAGKHGGGDSRASRL